MASIPYARESRNHAGALTKERARLFGRRIFGCDAIAFRLIGRQGFAIADDLTADRLERRDLGKIVSIAFHDASTARLGDTARKEDIAAMLRRLEARDIALRAFRFFLAGH